MCFSISYINFSTFTFHSFIIYLEYTFIGDITRKKAEFFNPPPPYFEANFTLSINVTTIVSL